jgi:hypothetical protein
MIITQAVFGYPQVYSQSLITIKSLEKDGTSTDLLDSIGIMVYQDAQSLK